MIYKLIIISCVVFVIALLLYALVVYREKFKNFILKVDSKLTARNEKYEKNKEENSKKNKDNETKLLTYSEETKESSSKQANKNKENKQNKSNEKTKKSSQDKQNKESEAKLKPSKAVEQVRPVLLPPNKEAEEQDIKLLEMQKRPGMLDSSPQKALDFKYGSKSTMQSQSANKSKPIKINNHDDDDDFISFNLNTKGSYNPLKRDTKKQFDDIKNFLDLPENQETINTKGVSYNGKEFKTVNKIDPSVFKNENDYYVNYNSPNKKQPLSIYDNYRNQNNLINSANNKSTSENDLRSFNEVKKFIDGDGNEVMQAQTKYAKPNKAGFSLTPARQREAEKYAPKTLPLTPEQENIDLNKLPNNLKKMIIQNILDRKNYDD